MRKLVFLFLFVSLVGCGRGQSDLYRAYNVSPMLDGSTGKVTEDLATQNRNSLQTGGEVSYLYVAPEQPGSKDTSKSDSSSSDKTAAQSAESTASSSDSTADDTAADTTDDASIPDDVAGSRDGKQAIADKIDNLKKTVSDLSKK